MGMNTKSKQQSSVKLKRGSRPWEEDEDRGDAQPAVAPNLLSSYGERFMSMFDDYDEEAVEAQRQREQSSKNAGSTCSEQQRHTCKQEGLSAHRSKEDAGGPQLSGKRKEGRDDAENSPVPRHAKKGRGAPKDEIEEIIFNDKPQGSSSHSVPSASVIDHPSESLDLERRLFMSSKASKVHMNAQAQLPSSIGLAEEEPDPELTPEEFKRLQLEVERLGASALDKRERKKWQAAMLSRLGAKPDKSPRTPAAIGIGMAKKQAQRDAKKLEEAFETGMAQRKGMGKKKRAAQSKNRDFGLQELGRGFKGGVLHLKKPGKGKRTGVKDAGPVRKMGSKGGGKGGKKSMKLPF